MRRYRAPSTALGTFFVVQFSADCTTNMSGFDLRQGQVFMIARTVFGTLLIASSFDPRWTPEQSFAWQSSNELNEQFGVRPEQTRFSWIDIQ